MKKLDFDIIEFDHSVFVSKNKKYYIAVYVNDLLLFDFDIKYINFIKIRLNQRFEMIDFDFAQHYLNIEIIRENDFILLRQTTYLKKILKRFDMNKCFFVNSSMKFELVNVLIFIKKNQRINDDTLYWYDSIVKSLMYIAINIRSNILYTICLFVRNKNSKSSRNCDSNFVKQFDHRSSNDLEKNQSQSFYNSINDTFNRLKLSVEIYRARTIE